MKLADLTWPEAAARIAANPQLTIPVGTVEQHGRHLPLNTDILVAESCAEFLSNEFGLLIAPTVNYGVNLPCDRIYPGTTTIPAETLQSTLSSLVEWWKLQGFQRFLVLSAHGDPHHIRALRDAASACAHVLELYDFKMDDLLETQPCAKHACEAETSIMLHLFPALVRQDQIVDFETPFEQFRPYLHHEKTDPIAGSPGCQGYPSRASAEKGKRLWTRMQEHALEWARQIMQAG
ncbi:MAG: creatininase family protein [Elusimicrobia bacterium]|nr:creatininase family protein [Elusimicrobiota bacterium]